MAQIGAWRPRAEHVRLPVQERRIGFTHLQKSQVLVAALAAGCQQSRDSNFTLSPDPVAAAALGLPRWPHSSQLTRHLRAFGAQHVAVALDQQGRLLGTRTIPTTAAG